MTTKIDRDGKIYVWDKVASIYSQTRLKSASQFVLPHINTAQKNNEKILIALKFFLQALYRSNNIPMNMPPYIVAKKAPKSCVNGIII